MVQIVIRRDKEGLLVMNIEHDDSRFDDVGIAVPEKLASELKAELKRHPGADFFDDLGTATSMAIKMLEG